MKDHRYPDRLLRCCRFAVGFLTVINVGIDRNEADLPHWRRAVSALSCAAQFVQNRHDLLRLAECVGCLQATGEYPHYPKEDVIINSSSSSD